MTRHILSAFVIMGAFAAAQVWAAVSPQDQYLQIYLLIQEADRLENAGQKASARKRYEISLDRLTKLQADHPEWETAIVKYRIKYCNVELEKLATAVDENPDQNVPPIPQELDVDAAAFSQAPRAETITPGFAPLPGTSDESIPTASSVDQPPRAVIVDDLAVPETGQESSTPSVFSENPPLVPAPLPPAYAVVDVMPGAPKLETDDPAALKARIQELESELGETKEKMEQARTEVAMLRTQVTQLEENLQKAREANADEQTKILLEENRELKDKLKTAESQIANFQTGVEGPSVVNLQQQIKKVQDQLALARQENEALRKTTQEYKTKLAQAEKDLEAAKSGLPGAKVAGPEAATMKNEIAILKSVIQRQLKEQARREVAKRIALEELETLAVESEKLKTQIDILGSPLVELSEEEKALLREPEAGLVVDSTTGTIAAPLVSEREPVTEADYSSKPRVPNEFKEAAQEANNLFSQQKFDEAAQKYETILATYPNSLYALSNVAVVRFQQQNYPEAEKHLQRAVKLAPQDAFVHSVLGIVLYQQGKFDEAVQVLTRAVALDQNDPKTRNYLGIAASQKGWQEAAEQECRKAIELDPLYGDAQFNLAVIYATQRPPSKELARKHYRRSLELGVPPDDHLESLLK